ncbi:MAG: hypothetical protein K0R98_1705 [Rickettsiaceae bacterium]|jgi:hypothetical protein|nr:hypothetical protein [Rickettsiaceae bacterium]
MGQKYFFVIPIIVSLIIPYFLYYCYKLKGYGACLCLFLNSISLGVLLLCMLSGGGDGLFGFLMYGAFWEILVGGITIVCLIVALARKQQLRNLFFLLSVFLVHALMFFYSMKEVYLADWT